MQHEAEVIAKLALIMREVPKCPTIEQVVTNAHNSKLTGTQVSILNFKASFIMHKNINQLKRQENEAGRSVFPSLPRKERTPYFSFPTSCTKFEFGYTCFLFHFPLQTHFKRFKEFCPGKTSVHQKIVKLQMEWSYNLKQSSHGFSSRLPVVNRENGERARFLCFANNS